MNVPNKYIFQILTEKNEKKGITDRNPETPLKNKNLKDRGSENTAKNPQRNENLAELWPKFKNISKSAADPATNFRLLLEV